VWRDPSLHDIGRESGAVVGGEPALVGLLHMVRELDVELTPLVLLRLLQTGIVDLVQLHVPLRAPRVEVDPPAPVERGRRLHAEPRELGDVIARPAALLKPVGLEEALQGQEDLLWKDRLQEEIVDAPADRIVHERFRLVLGHEDDRHRRVLLLDRLERLEPAHPRHRFVEEHGVELLARGAGYGIVPVRHGRHQKPLLLEKEDMGLQEIDLVVGPEDLSRRRVHAWEPGGGGTGRATATAVPRPGTLSTMEMRPPWYSAITRLASVSPRPQPRRFVV
jgi:hypothetical protein